MMKICDRSNWHNWLARLYHCGITVPMDSARFSNTAKENHVACMLMLIDCIFLHLFRFSCLSVNCRSVSDRPCKTWEDRRAFFHIFSIWCIKIWQKDVARAIVWTVPLLVGRLEDQIIKIKWVVFHCRIRLWLLIETGQETSTSTVTTKTDEEMPRILGRLTPRSSTIQDLSYLVFFKVLRAKQAISLG